MADSSRTQRAGLVHVLKALTQLRVAVERHRRVDDRAEIDVRSDPAIADQGRARFEHRRIAQVTANHRQQRELAQRLMKGSV